jgi:hypothetical protein
MGRVGRGDDAFKTPIRSGTNRCPEEADPMSAPRAEIGPRGSSGRRQVSRFVSSAHRLDDTSSSNR